MTTETTGETVQDFNNQNERDAGPISMHQYAKRRSSTQTCKYCGETGLTWYQPKDTSRNRNGSLENKWVMGNDDWTKHKCWTARRDEKTGEESTATIATVTATDEDTITRLVKDAIEGKFDSELTDTIKGAVKEAAESMLPREHILVVANDNTGEVTRTEGRPHFKLQTLISVMGTRTHVFMVGGAGSGKTTAAHQAADALGLPYYEPSMGPATSQWDLFGYKSPDGAYIEGILRQPFEHGGVLMLDEIDNSNPSVLTALNSALANGKATFPDGSVERHPDFICIAAGNTYGRGADRLYVGRLQLDAATLDRFANIAWDYDEEAEIDWAGADQSEWTQFVQRTRHAVEGNNMRVVVSPRASINGAKLLRAGMGRDEVAEMVLYKGMSRDDKDRLPDIRSHITDIND